MSAIFRSVTPVKTRNPTNQPLLTPMDKIVKNKDLKCPGAPARPQRLLDVDTDVKITFTPFIGPIRPDSKEEENISFGLLLTPE